jgi:site-specific DNA recombinase
MRTILDAAAAYERALIRGRTRAALAVKKSRGERVGGVPYGFRVGADGKGLERDDHEQAVIEELRQLRRSGVTFRRLQHLGAAKGLTGRTGRPFTLQALHRLVVSASTNGCEN